MSDCCSDDELEALAEKLRDEMIAKLNELREQLERPNASRFWTIPSIWVPTSLRRPFKQTS